MLGNFPISSLPLADIASVSSTAVCTGLPLVSGETTTPPCTGSFACQDNSTNPPGITCSTMTYVFGAYNFSGGNVRSGALGAYLPAAAVCRYNIAPISINQTKFYPNMTLVATTIPPETLTSGTGL